MCRTVPSALVLLCLAAGDLAAQAVRSLTPTQVARLDSAVAAVLEEHEAVGLQVAVGLGDRVAWGGWAGMADLEHDVPVTPETRFRTASITKWMTATAAMRLAEQGKLDLDAPVQRYCPTYPEKRWTLTARHLLSHRGGVRHYWGANDESRETPAQRVEIERRSEEERLWQIVRYGDVVRPVERFEDDSLLFEPGTRYHYTSLGYRLLGCVLRGAAVDSYDDLMEELVFRPAGMVHTRPDDAHAIIPGRAMGYVRRGNRLERSRFRDVSENLPAGGHVSSAADLVRFALAWNRGALVSEESRRRMTAPPGSEPDAESYYGYGVNVRHTPGRTFLSHGGGQDATRTLLVLLPDEEIAVAAMTNYESIEDGLTELVEWALAIVAGGEPSAAEPEPGPPSPSRSGSRRDAPGTAPAPDGNAAAGAPAARAPAAVLFLLRHAETLTSTSGEGRPDPSLSETGRARAQALARALGAAGVTAVWSSAYRRTQETAAPLAAALGLDVEPYDASRLDEVAGALAGGEGRIVVVGHSNTTPRLVELLGGDPGEPIDERTEYDRLYVLIRDGAGEVTTIRLHYGPG